MNEVMKSAGGAWKRKVSSTVRKPAKWVRMPVIWKRKSKRKLEFWAGGRERFRNEGNEKFRNQIKKMQQKHQPLD